MIGYTLANMGLVLYGITASEFWHSGHIRDLPEFGPTSQALADICKFEAREVIRRMRNAGGATDGIHVLVDGAKDRRSSDWIVYHYYARPEQLPSGSFYQIGHDLYCASPELCFVQLGAQLPPLELIRAGFDLCSKYRVSPFDNMDLIECEPCTNASALYAYATKAAGINGFRQAIKAAKWVLDNSRSPRETSAAILMNLPTRMGGYQLPGLVMNMPVHPSKEALKMARKSYFEIDLCCPELNEYFEYQSKQFHHALLQGDFDYEKMGVLQAMGYNLTPISTWQLTHFDAIDVLLRNARSRMGMRERMNSRIMRRRRSTHYDIMEAERLARSAPSLCDTARWRFLLSEL